MFEVVLTQEDADNYIYQHKLPTKIKITSEGHLCIDIISNKKWVKLIWKSNNDYLPSDYMYDFLEQYFTNTYTIDRKWEVKDNITTHELTLDITMEQILERLKVK